MKILGLNLYISRLLDFDFLYKKTKRKGKTHENKEYDEYNL